MNKVAVAVSCQIDTDGNIHPLCIKWKDGRKWEIERVLHTCRSPDQSFEGIRYTILIGGVEKYLYQNSMHWYVNAPAQEEQEPDENIGHISRDRTGRRKPDPQVHW